MIITFHGKQALKCVFGDLTIALNPVSKDTTCDLDPARFGADIALISMNHPDFNGVDMVTYGEKIPFVIDGPGEYEHRDIFFKGYGFETMYKGEQYINTVYSFKLDGIDVLFFGAMSQATFDATMYEQLGTADIVIVPIGGDDVLSPRDAHKLSLKMTPGIIIPIDYGSDRDANSLANFAKEAGLESLKSEEKLTLKQKDLQGREGDVIILAS